MRIRSEPDRRVGPVAAVSALAALLIGCSAPTGGVPMFVAFSSDRLLAALEGELAVRDDCLVLDVGNATYAIAWHSSVTTWHAADKRIEVEGVAAEVGDRVALGGGEWPMQSLDDWDWLIAPNAGCLAQDGFWMAWSLEHL